MGGKEEDGDKERLEFQGSTKVGTRGQIVVPVSARRAIGLRSGDELAVFIRDPGVLVLVKINQPEATS